MLLGPIPELTEARKKIMVAQGFWSEQRVAGALMVAAFVPLTLGIFLFLSRNGIQGGAPRSTAHFVWERGSLLAAVILTAAGLMVLETILQPTDGRTMARLGAGIYFFGAVLLVAAEAMQLPQGEVSYPLIVIYVVLALVGQAAIGVALLQSGLLPAWVGWATLAWNLAFLVVLPIATPRDLYFPILHHLMPLLIGLALLWRG
jgi:hypothetical protein